MRDWSPVTPVSLCKYEAAGNDFVFFLDPSALPGTDELDKDFVVGLCDRHRGIGADGVVVLRPAPGAAIGREGVPPAGAMELRNADGGRAETSGNALRCLALALFDSGLSGREALVLTDAGPRRTQVLERLDGTSAIVRTEMGRAAVEQAQPVPDLGARWSARHVSVGNPHLVLIGDSLEGIDIIALGRSYEGAVPGGQNVEAIAPDGRGGLDLLVFERGAGPTRSCGSGSCAAAAAARSIGLVGEHVEVHNPGGGLVVELEGEPSAPEVSLIGPARRVFRLQLDAAEMESLAGGGT
jgi:diaminopimelate epimerase